VSLFAVYAALRLMPLIIDLVADRKWAFISASAEEVKVDA